MKKVILAVLLMVIAIQQLHAQTKVFKEVSEGISTKLRTIMQDGTLVGYISFTELEKVDKDSFSYKITIMDENLNNLGVVTFKELKLDLKQVSFEKDTLCLAYLKSNVLGYQFQKRSERSLALKEGYLSVFAQFISLDGKIAHTTERKLTVNIRGAWDISRLGGRIDGILKASLQLKNMHDKGFTLLFGDNDHNYLLVYNTQGELLWEKYIASGSEQYYLLTSGHDAYILMKDKVKARLGGYTLVSYDTDTREGILKYPLEDDKKNPLQVTAIENDPVTGTPSVSGYILNPKRAGKFGSVKGLTQKLYKGIFTINVTGHEKSAVKRLFTYWDDNSTPNISQKGYISATRGYIFPSVSFRDYNGNTFFAGSNLTRKPRWGGIIPAVVTAPLIIPAYMIASVGFLKFRITDGIVIKQDGRGKIMEINSVAAARGGNLQGGMPVYDVRPHVFYTVTSPETKSTFLIQTDSKKSTIYNVDQQKIVRTIPHVDGDIIKSIYPAKEGHVIISEYNRKENYTKYSIEAI